MIGVERLPSLASNTVDVIRNNVPGDMPSKALAVARLGSDMYESTIRALDDLNPKVSRGGYLSVDDYHAVKACRMAVSDHRAAHGVMRKLSRSVARMSSGKSFSRKDLRVDLRLYVGWQGPLSGRLLG